MIMTESYETNCNVILKTKVKKNGSLFHEIRGNLHFAYCKATSTMKNLQQFIFCFLSSWLFFFIKNKGTLLASLLNLVRMLIKRIKTEALQIESHQKIKKKSF